MNWSIEYYGPKLEKEILKLPGGLLARYFHLTDLMIEFGSNLLHVFIKKTQKIPKKELKLATQRMKEVLGDES